MHVKPTAAALMAVLTAALFMAALSAITAPAGADEGPMAAGELEPTSPLSLDYTYSFTLKDPDEDEDVSIYYDARPTDLEEGDQLTVEAEVTQGEEVWFFIIKGEDLDDYEAGQLTFEDALDGPYTNKSAGDTVTLEHTAEFSGEHLIITENHGPGEASIEMESNHMIFEDVLDDLPDICGVCFSVGGIGALMALGMALTLRRR